MGANNSSGIPQGPALGNVALPDSYIRIVQNIDALNNAVLGLHSRIDEQANQQVLIGGNNIRVFQNQKLGQTVIEAADDAWLKTWMPAVTCSNGTPTSGNLETGLSFSGKSLKLRLYWDGSISVASRDLLFALPARVVVQTFFQTLYGSYGVAGAPLVPIGPLTVEVSRNSNAIICRSTVNFPSGNNIAIVLGGGLELA